MTISGHGAKSLVAQYESNIIVAMGQHYKTCHDWAWSQVGTHPDIRLECLSCMLRESLILHHQGPPHVVRTLCSVLLCAVISLKLLALAECIPESVVSLVMFLIPFQAAF